ncbi:MAG: ribosome hibernation-promoting factor, HPF/YfiA family [Wujia sp.]
MNYIISGKNIEVTEAIKSAIYEKLSKIEKFFAEDTDAQVTLSVDKERQKIEVTIPMKGHTIRAEQSSENMYVSIDMVVEIIERQVTRYKKKIVDKEQNAGFINNDFFDVGDLEDEDVQIIRSKKVVLEPMYPEDACVQMDLLGHNFYVFCNAETDKVNVVYKRKGNTFGLIEPEF